MPDAPVDRPARDADRKKDCTGSAGCSSVTRKDSGIASRQREVPLATEGGDDMDSATAAYGYDVKPSTLAVRRPSAPSFLQAPSNRPVKHGAGRGRMSGWTQALVMAGPAIVGGVCNRARIQTPNVFSTRLGPPPGRSPV